MQEPDRWEKVAVVLLACHGPAARAGLGWSRRKRRRTRARCSGASTRMFQLSLLLFLSSVVFLPEGYRRRSSSREQRLFLPSMTSRDPTRWAPGMQRRRWRRWGTLFRMPSCSTCSAPTTARKGSRAAVLPSLFGTCLRSQHLTLAWAQVGVVREISPDVRHRPDRRRR